MNILFRKSYDAPSHRRMTAQTVGRLKAGSVVLAAWFGLFVMGSAHAIDIPALPVVQPGIAAVNPALVQQRETLLKERKALLDRTNSHNQRCDAVEEGSDADASCTKAYLVLEVAIKSHVRTSKQYHDDYLAAVNLDAGPKPAPSGLWKGLDNAIAGAYADAPPGVSARVRKGFQAVMDRDWKVARAWFEDALKRDPANAGLKRLVGLTDSSQQPDHHPVTMDAPNEPRNTPEPVSTTNPSLPLPDPDDISYLFPGLKPVEDQELMDILFGLDTQAPSQTTSGHKSRPLPPKAEMKPNWKAFFDALTKNPPKSKYPQVAAPRG